MLARGSVVVVIVPSISVVTMRIATPVVATGIATSGDQRNRGHHQQ